MPPTITDYFGKASVDTDYAIATTVKTTRTTGVTVLEAFDLSKYADDTPVFFVTYKKVTDPVTEITSVVDLVSWKGIVNTAANTLTNLTVAPGYTDIGNDIGDFVECIPTSYWENSLIEGIFVGHNPDGTFKKSALQSALGNDGQLVQALDEIIADFVQSGGVWATVSGVNASMTALVGYIDGYRNTIAAIASKSFTVSKDTYIDVKRDTTTNAFSLVYTEVANGAATPALAAHSMRIAKVTTNSSSITSITQSGMDDNTATSNTIFPNKPVQANSNLAVRTWVDANGWQVTDYGSKKVYKKRMGNGGYALGTGEVDVNLYNTALPVDVTAAQVTTSNTRLTLDGLWAGTSWAMTFKGHRLVFGSSLTVSAHFLNSAGVTNQINVAHWVEIEL